jgi:hypothetical protein
MSAPQPTPGPDLTREYIISRGDLLTERNQLAAECERLRAERDALRAALASLIALSNDIEAELEHTGAINDSSLSPASQTEPYRIAVAALNQ